MIAIVHSIYSQSVHAPALNAGLIDNDAVRCCRYISKEINSYEIIRFALLLSDGTVLTGKFRVGVPLNIQSIYISILFG